MVSFSVVTVIPKLAVFLPTFSKSKFSIFTLSFWAKAVKFSLFVFGTIITNSSPPHLPT
jgi:hypothetical protein